MPNDPRYSRHVAVAGHTGTLVIDTHVDQPETMPLEASKQKIPTTKISKRTYKGEYRGREFEVWGDDEGFWFAKGNGFPDVIGKETKTKAVNKVKVLIDRSRANY